MFQIGITERGDAGLDWEQVQSQLWRVAGTILITKAPQLLPVKELPSNTVVHCTITGWAGTKIEPNVADIETCIQGYYQVLDALGPERTVLRVDPIFPSEIGFAKALHILSKAPIRARTRISFFDAYPHVRARFQAVGIDVPWEGLHAPLELRQKFLTMLPEGRIVEICGEPSMKCDGCVSNRDLQAMGLQTVDLQGKSQQRLTCCCLAAKVELLNNKHPCAHQCLYCYWKDQ